VFGIGVKQPTTPRKTQAIAAIHPSHPDLNNGVVVQDDHAGARFCSTSKNLAGRMHVPCTTMRDLGILFAEPIFRESRVFFFARSLQIDSGNDAH
jgi:hypothetical protein